MPTNSESDRLNTDANTPTPPASIRPSILTRDDGAAIAYHQTKGKSPGVVFLPGFMSDMTGGKATALEDHCKKLGHAFLRFDYTGHGESSGAFTDGTIGSWSEDAVHALDQLTEGPQILVGSSMGGWIMLLTALARPERIAGMVGIAPAPDFTVDLFEKELSDEQRWEMEETGMVLVPSEYGPEPTPFTRRLIEDGKNRLLLKNVIALDCPTRILHGMKDPDVPWQTSLKIADKLRAQDVVMTFIKDGDHRLSRDEDIDRLKKTVGDLIDQVRGG
jgi:pimeloyl-ACP methyl ester carboxylesterase